MHPPDKARLLDALRRQVADDLHALLRMASDSRDEATGSESRAENQYDTRATEASYLAAGQGRRLVGLHALSAWLGALDPVPVLQSVGAGALVGLRRGGDVEWVLLAPEGGHVVRVDDREVRLISTGSPAGEVLDGLAAGDVVDVETPRGPIEVEIAAVR